MGIQALVDDRGRRFHLAVREKEAGDAAAQVGILRVLGEQSLPRRHRLVRVAERPFGVRADAELDGRVRRQAVCERQRLAGLVRLKIQLGEEIAETGIVGRRRVRCFQDRGGLVRHVARFGPLHPRRDQVRIGWLLRQGIAQQGRGAVPVALQHHHASQVGQDQRRRRVPGPCAFERVARALQIELRQPDGAREHVELFRVAMCGPQHLERGGGPVHLPGTQRRNHQRGRSVGTGRRRGCIRRVDQNWVRATSGSACVQDGLQHV